MKKLVFSIMCIVSIASMNAQSNLPQTGDQSLQLDALPVVNLLGNMFNGSTGNNFFYSTDFTYRKFLNDSKARTHRVFFGGRGDRVDIHNFSSNGEVSTISRYNRSYNAAYFWGTEYRKSLKNVQGYVGYELTGGLFGSSVNYDYKSSYIDSTNFGSRTLEDIDYPTIEAGVNFNIGADYFFACNFSVGVVLRNGARLSYDTGREIKRETDISLGSTKQTVTEEASWGYRLFSGSFGLNFSWIF